MRFISILHVILVRQARQNPRLHPPVYPRNLLQVHLQVRRQHLHQAVRQHLHQAVRQVRLLLAAQAPILRVLVAQALILPVHRVLVVQVLAA